MSGKRIRCFQIVSQNVPSIFNSFPVIRTASAKHRRFHVPQPTFLFPLKTPLRLSRNMLHGWKDSSMPAKRLAACTKRGGAIPTETILTGASNARGYDKMPIFSQISRSISETVIVRWAHAARQFVSIEFPFHPYNIYSFWRNLRTWRTDGHCMTAKTALIHRIAR